MKTLALSLSLAVLAGCGVAFAEQAAQPDPGWGGPDASFTKAQAQDMAGRMFDRMDFNHDGKLDASDREGRRAEMKAAMFARMDANHDGQISRDEFMNFKLGGPEGMGGHDMHGPMGGPGMEGPGGEGHMGMGGHRGMGMGMGMGGMHGMGGMLMHMADTNHDGVVTRDEFMAAFMKHFDEMDANHDGTVSPEERRAAHEAMRQHMGHGSMDGHEMGGHDMGGMDMGRPGGAMPPPPEGN